MVSMLLVDSLSRLLSVLKLIPLYSSDIGKKENWKETWKRQVNFQSLAIYRQLKVNILLDLNLKFYGRLHEELESLVEVVRMLSRDIKKDIVLDKYGQLQFEAEEFVLAGMVLNQPR